jgi:hypothetical protein
MNTTSSTGKKTLVLIDAHSLIHRCFHAIPPLHAPNGQPTNALYGVANTLYKIFQEIQPEYAAAAFDRPEKTFRKQEYELYNAQRPILPNTLTIIQITAINPTPTSISIMAVASAGTAVSSCIYTICLDNGPYTYSFLSFSLDGNDYRHITLIMKAMLPRPIQAGPSNTLFGKIEFPYRRSTGTIISVSSRTPGNQHVDNHCCCYPRSRY